MRERKKVTIVIMLILLFSMSLQFGQGMVQAKNGPVTIKVAFYQLDGFFEYDENGNECGYGVDYLNELKKYADIEWEYVPVDSWEKIGQMISDGEVDVRMPVSEPVSTSEKYNYSSEPVITTYHSIMTLKSREDLYFKDFDTIAKMKIGVTTGLLERTGFADYLESIGVIDNLQYYDDYNSCKAALEKGEIDGLVSNIMDLTDDMKILDKFVVTKNYITTIKSNPYYSLINSAMTELELANPSFLTDLYESYYPERAVDPFTKEETQFIQNTDSLTVAVFDDREPVSYFDPETGTYKGIAIDIANAISEQIGIPFDYVSITTDDSKEMLSSVDLVMPSVGPVSDDKYFSTSSLFDSEVVFVTKTGKNELKEGDTIATLKSTKGIKNTIIGLDKYKVVEYDTNDDALTALKKGKIDGFANSLYVMNWLLENPRYSNLSIMRYNSIPLEFSMCGSIDNIELQNIIDKEIQLLSSETVDNIINSDTKFSLSNLSISDKFFIYRNEIQMICIIIILCITAFAVYIISRNKYIKEIEEKNREQEIANHAKSNFLARMSHDMRTPMNAIIGMSYLGMESDSLVEQKDYHKKINNSGKYLLGLINDTLDMSKMDSDKMELHPEPYFSKDFIDSIKVMFNEKAKEKKIDLDIQIKNNKKFALMMDKMRIQQIFVNLINNALKFTPENGKVSFIITVGEIIDNKTDLIFTVTDNGCGMTKEFQEKMYEPFEQEERKNTVVETGTGLGLAIVKQIVDLMGGTIECNSEINKGTEFIVKLQAEICKDYIPEINKENEVYENDILEGKRVLLCDDHPLNIEISKRLLEREKMIVETAENGQIAFELFTASKPFYYDAILMDVRMPVMDGLEATRYIRRLDREDAKKVPIIAMTANAFADDIKETRDAGMNEHLAKPVDAELLYEALRKYIFDT